MADVPGAQALLAEAREWLADRSIDQWQDPVPDSVIEADVDRGGLFVVRSGRDLAATISLARSDLDTWGQQPADALYVHRLAVAQRHRGARLGAELLRWASDHAVQHGCTWLRLDCAADNPGLRRFYEREGFFYVRDQMVQAPDRARRFRVSLYQRPAGAG